MWQLYAFVAIVVVIVAAVLLLTLGGGDDDAPDLTSGDTSSTTTTVAEGTVGGTFVAPPRQPVQSSTTSTASTTTTPATDSTADPDGGTTSPPSSSASTSTTTSSTTTTSSSTTSTTVPPRSADPGPTHETDGIDDSDVQSALDDARRRWEDKGPQSGYRFRTVFRCSCPDGPYRNEISVNARDEVVGQRTISGRAEQDPPTVDALFDQVQEALDDGGDLSVSFDRIWGYPVEIRIDPDPLTSDDEVNRDVEWVTE